jgi:outer membrane receptor protein involved in Fe transport
VDEVTNMGLGLFAKSIEDPIVDAFDPVLNAQSWINGEQGTINGIEFEANTLIVDRYRIGGNYTFINSDLEYTLRGRKLNTGFTGQPEHIFNLFAGYEDKENGISANFIYNYTGTYMSEAPATPNAPSIMEEAFESLDFILQKSFTAWECDGKVTLGVRNILDSTRRQFFSPGDFTFRESKPGRTLSLSCEIKF